MLCGQYKMTECVKRDITICKHEHVAEVDME